MGAEVHPSDDLLLAHNDGVLFPGDRPLVEGHLKGCTRCRARLAALTDDIAVPAQVASKPAPRTREQSSTGRTFGPLLRRLAVVAALLAILGTAGVAARREIVRRSAEPVALAPAPARPPKPSARALDVLAPPVAEETPEAAAASAVASNVSPAATAAPVVSDPSAIIIASPNPDFRWRLTGLNVERTTNGGKEWLKQAVDLPRPPVGGVAPSAAVCWLVGRGGAVFVGVGTSWKNVSMTEPVDLVRVTATDSMYATVTAADGRRFSTTDGGVRWDLLQP